VKNHLVQVNRPIVHLEEGLALLNLLQQRAAQALVHDGKALGVNGPQAAHREQKTLCYR